MSASVETAPYRAAFDAQRRAGEPTWLGDSRRTALARFEALGFPTRRSEDWRFTNLGALRRSSFAPAGGEAGTAPDLARWLYPDKTHRLVLIDGRLAPALCDIGMLPEGAYLAGTGKALEERPELAKALFDETDRIGGQAFASLNAALFADGFVLALDPGVVLERPVEIVHFGRAPQRSSQLRSLVRLGEGARATVIESFAGGAEHWLNAVARVELAPGAALRHAKLQDEDKSAIHLAQARAVLEKNARYEAFVLHLGGGLARHDIVVRFAGKDAACGLFGASLLRGEQEATVATLVDHAAPGCTTREYFKTVVDERAHGVFLGRIAVRPEAQKTDAHQLNKNLLLSPRANVDTKPELEIFADDVKCRHGATVGDLDEAALFYLETRGIPPAEARRMLIEAFAAEAIEQIEDDPGLRAYLARHVRRWLGRDEDEA
ncbi:MAG TPA: Fe-S cluster assembly protein SufD [Stellaceae bacterium]|nr:Fe-S cluster assembly protein SufD [Stellaceae bacterium]